MTGHQEFFSDLNTDIHGFVKFGDATTVEVGGIGSIILVTKTGERLRLTSIFYIPVLRNSIISLGQLDENGSLVEIDRGVLRIWDQRQRLLAEVVKGSNRLYVLYAKVEQLGTKEMVQDKMVDGGLTSTYYVHFEGAREAGSSSSPSVLTPVPRFPSTTASSSPASVNPPLTPASTPPGAVNSRPPPPQPATPHTPVPTATPSRSAAPTPAHDEYYTVEFATPLSNNEDCVDAHNNGESRFFSEVEGHVGVAKEMDAR